MSVFTKLFKSGLIVLLVAVAGLIIGTSAKAQEEASGNGLRITPIRKEFVLTNTQSDSYEIEVTNVSTADINVRVFVNDFESDNETGNPRLLVGPDEVSTHSIKEFVNVIDSFLLKPAETKKVRVDVKVPENAAPGGYYGVIRFAAGGGNENEGNVALNASVSSILLVSVPGEVTEAMSLDGIQVLKNDKAGNFFETPPDTVAIRLTNSGNSILKPFGTVNVLDWRGNEVYSYEFNGSLTRGNVLPQSSRLFKDQIENVGFIGKYTVSASLSYGEGGGNILYGSTSFWVVPWRALIGIMILITALIWFTTKGIKIYNRRIIEKAKRG